MRRKNGDGTIVKLTGNRRKPYACRKIVGWKEDGRPIIKYISYHRTKREAEKALADYNNDPYKLGTFTLQEVYEDWFSHQDDKSENTRHTYKTAWRKLEPLAGLKIQSIDRFELQNFFDHGEFTTSSLRQVRNLLKLLTEYAVKRGILPISALNLHKGIDYQTKRETRFRPHSVIRKQDIEALWQKKDDDTVRLMLIYIYTGCRFDELHKLLPENVHADEKYIEIKKAKTEAGNRIVPLSDKVLSLLQDGQIGDVPSHTTFSARFKEFLPKNVIHDTRHTFISMMAEAGVDDRIIKSIVGHKTSDITEVYTHISLETMLEAINKI